MTTRLFCLVCGNSDTDAEKLHCFPSNPIKSKLWQEKMGMCYTPLSLKNYRICNNHFTRDSYSDVRNWKLHVDAFPTENPCRKEANVSVAVAGTSSSLDINTQPSCSLETPSVPSTSKKSVFHLPSVLNTPKKSVFRGIENVSRIKSSPRKHKLIKLLESKEAHIRKLKKLCKTRGHNIKALSDLSDETVVRQLFHGMSHSTTNFIISQLRCAKRTPRARRWTTHEKIIALALLKKSPRSYNVLRKLVALPTRKTVLSLLSKIDFSPGINQHLFLHLTDFLRNDQDRCCVLLFDEMDIKENLIYDEKLDSIIGYEDLGFVSPNCMELAKKALVFMCVGLGSQKWKQPVAYFLTSKGCSSELLQQCIKSVIEACFDLAKLEVVATVCDMGSSNVSALKTLGSSLLRPYININDKNIFTIFDPPHLLKCTVSLFRKYNIHLPVEVLNNQVMEARFEDIRKAYEIDKETPFVFRHIHKIKDHYLAPKMNYAMKVNIAAQLMSRSVAAFLYTCTSKGVLDQRSIATATFVQQVDELFDSFNGSKSKNDNSEDGGKPLKYTVTSTSAHHRYWEKALCILKTWQYQRRTKTGSMKQAKPPSQFGWMLSITAMQGLWRKLHHFHGFQSLRARSLNQDPLENLFGVIRGGCGSGSNPTPFQFMASLKTQILNNLANKAVGSNCEEDDNLILTNLMHFLHSTESPLESTDITTTAVAPATTTLVQPQIAEINAEHVLTDIQNSVKSGSIHTLSVAYVSGFIGRRILSSIQKCSICEHDLSSSEVEPHNLFINFKEWSDDNKLFYPSENLVVAVGHGISVLENVLKCQKKLLTPIITAAIKDHVSFAFITCITHYSIIEMSVVRALIKIGVPWYCKRINGTKRDIINVKRKIKTFMHN